MSADRQVGGLVGISISFLEHNSATTENILIALCRTGHCGVFYARTTAQLVVSPGSLICHGVVSGAAVVTRQGQLLYSYGQLKNISRGDIGQFKDLFGISDKPDSLYNKDFRITLSSGVTSLHTAYQKTYSSVYATSKGNNGGLTVCNLPYGLLICVYPSEVNSGNAIKCIEAFCDLMRR